MPISCKIFVYREPKDLEEVLGVLDGYSEVEINEDLGVDLVTDFTELSFFGGDLTGLYMEDKIVGLKQREGIKWETMTVSASFILTRSGETVFLIVLAKKQVANKVANSLSKILHGEVGYVIESVIGPNALKGFYEGGEGTKILLFSDVVVPNMDKLALYGLNVIQTDLYGEYVNQGDPWYIVAKTIKQGYTVGLVRDGTVVVFNTIDKVDLLDYVKEEILPLILTRRRRREDEE